MARVMETNSHENTPEQEDAQNALKNYLKSLESGDFSHSFVSNCILDWFGCSVRGPKKIQQFLKHKIRTQQLRHSEFNKVEKCEPIEVKPTHMSTKKLSKSKDVKSYKTYNCAKSLKPDAESDEESDMSISDHGMDTTTPINSPTTSKAFQIVDETLCFTPLPLTDDEDDSTTCIAKRPKFIDMTTPKSSRKCTMIKANSDSEAEDAEAEAEKDANKYDNYLSLHYLESTGHLLTLNLTDVVDRMVRLRISYRKNLTNKNELQYALIVYEYLQDDGKVKGMPRKNLSFAFNEGLQKNNNDNEDVLVVVSASDQQEQQQIDESMERPSTPIRMSTIITTSTTLSNFSNDLYDDDDMNLVANAGLRTPTKVSTDPPATPRRRRRDGHMHLKRSYDLVPSHSTNADGSRKTAKKCNAARTLRL